MPLKTKSTDAITMAQLLLHTPGASQPTELGWMSTLGDNLRVSFAAAYVADRDRPTLSQLYTGANDAESRAILTARDDERLVRIGKLPSYFGNLLPEGPNRQRLADRRGVSVDDEFELLAAAGHDLIGGLEVVPATHDIPAEVLNLHVTKGMEPLEANAVASPSDDGFSVGGYATKFSMVASGRRYVIRTGTTAGEILAKLPSTEYPDLVENEALCYALAEAVGITTAGATSRPIAELDLPEHVTKAFSHYLHVPRFDRALQPDGTIRRIHFEELAQAVGRDARNKYKDLPQAMQALLGVLKTSPASGILDLKEVFRRWTAYALMGNTDAHAKNWALMYLDGRHPTLAPAYDMVCVSAYFDPAEPTRLGVNRAMDASLSTWNEDEAERLAKSVGILQFNAMRKVVRDTRRLAKNNWPAILDTAPAHLASHLRQRLAQWAV